MSPETAAPADADIREALHAMLRAAHAGDASTVVLDELALCRGQTRVDVTVVNGTLHGYEIKSDRDSLHRLRSQVDHYGRVLDRATLVVGGRHLAEARRCVPRWWGLIKATGRPGAVQLRPLRKGMPNPSRDPAAVVELLWRADALGLLERYGAARGVRGKARWVVWERVCQVVPLDDIASEARRSLRGRGATRGPLL